MASLTKEQYLDLVAIKANPGIYSKQPPNRCWELGELQQHGLIKWRYNGGYEITDAGRALAKAKEAE